MEKLTSRGGKKTPLKAKALEARTFELALALN